GRDITERIQAENRLRASEQRFALAVQGSSDGIWDWNIETGEVYYSPRYKQMLGYAEDEFGDRLESFSSHLHPEDSHATWEATTASLERGEPYNVLFRLRTKSSEWRWFRSRGGALRDADG